MADYVMLEDIFETTENMTVLRDNSYNDDGTDTVAGVDWFKFRETTAANFYVSGNTWIGIGQNSEQLKISRRDADLYTLKREEGTLLSNYKFFRIRWEGYSVHGNNNASTRLVWDALFFDTGDIVCIQYWGMCSIHKIKEHIILDCKGKDCYIPSSG